MYFAPQNIPRTVSVLILGNNVILYCVCVYVCVSVFVCVCQSVCMYVCGGGGGEGRGRCTCIARNRKASQCTHLAEKASSCLKNFSQTG